MKRVIILLIVVIVTVGCNGNKSRKIVYDGFAQGTTYHIAFHSENGKSISQNSIDSILSVFDKSCSLYDSTSLIVAINNNLTDSLDSNILGCIDIAREMNEISDGLFDITIKPLTQAYGFLTTSAQNTINIDSILNFVGMDKFLVVDNRIVKSSENISLDLNSIAQGYAVDLIAELLKSRGINDFIVEVGGEIYCGGDNKGESWSVGIDSPVDNNFVPGADITAVIKLKDMGLTTSGNYRKFYEKDGKRINHTINPKTGQSSQNNMLSATVLASSAAIADGYTTTFMLMGLDKSVAYLKENPQIQALLIYHENDEIKSYVTENLKSQIILKKTKN